MIVFSKIIYQILKLPIPNKLMAGTTDPPLYSLSKHVEQAHIRTTAVGAFLL